MLALKVLEDVVESATCAQAHHQVWWALANRIYPDLEVRANEYGDFFTVSSHAHYTAMFVNLAHLFERRHDTSSISRYLALADQSNPLLPQFRQQFQALAVRAEPMVKARHKSVAHVDAFLSEREVFADLSFTWNELRDVIEDSCTLVRALVRDAALSRAVFDGSRYGDATLELIRALSPRRA